MDRVLRPKQYLVLFLETQMFLTFNSRGDVNECLQVHALNSNEPVEVFESSDSVRTGWIKARLRTIHLVIE